MTPLDLQHGGVLGVHGKYQWQVRRAFLYEVPTTSWEDTPKSDLDITEAKMQLMVKGPSFVRTGLSSAVKAQEQDVCISK